MKTINMILMLVLVANSIMSITCSGRGDNQCIDAGNAHPDEIHPTVQDLTTWVKQMKGTYLGEKGGSSCDARCKFSKFHFGFEFNENECCCGQTLHRVADPTKSL